MSRRPAKLRAASGRAFGTSSPSGFGGFSTTSSGSNLSYLSEPPDLSSISDAHAVVSFKNLSKKDATTKAKALEELVAFVEAHPHEHDGGAEEPLLEAWVNIYPRIAIDNSRRVRELSHTLQIELMKSARKRMERHVPKIVGTWLAGTFDRDRVVSRVAIDGLSSFLTNEEKVLNFWKRCQPQILEYAQDAIRETPDTLSDERSTNADDADAKFQRVVGGSLALVLNLLQKLEPADLNKCQEQYDQFFELDEVWKSITSSDASVRRLCCQVLVACLEKRKESISADLSRISKIFVGDGLKSPQTGSASDYVESLTILTAGYPTVWTTDYHGKKSLSSRLKAFVEKGSQSSSAKYWSSLGQLLTILPKELQPLEIEGASDFVKSIRSGLSSREEARSNSLDAWICYLNASRLFLDHLESDESRVRFCQENIAPLTEQYLFPQAENSMWSSGSQIPVLLKAYGITSMPEGTAVSKSIQEDWARYQGILRDHIRNSLPEASKEFEKSQKTVSDEGNRWFILTGKILEGHSKTIGTQRPIPDLPRIPSLELLREAVRILQTRNWKPFGAAACLESALKQSPELFSDNDPGVTELMENLESAISSDFSLFIQAPAALYVCSAINRLGDIDQRKVEYERLWSSIINAIVADAASPRSASALVKLLSNKAASLLSHKSQALQANLLERCMSWVNGTADFEQDLFDTVANHDVLTKDSSKELLSKMASSLVQSRGAVHTNLIRGLGAIAQRQPALLGEDETLHMTLMTNLLSLSEREGNNPDLDTLRSLLENPSASSGNVVTIIQQNLQVPGPRPLGIDTLVQQATQVLESAQGSTDGSTLQTTAVSLLPDLTAWDLSLSQTLQTAPNPSLSLTSSLGDAYFIVNEEPIGSSEKINRDQSGCSVAGRMALYSARLLSSGLDLAMIPDAQQVGLIQRLNITAELASDQLAIMDRNKVWSSLDTGECLSNAEFLVASASKILDTLTEDAKDWRDGSGSTQSRIVNQLFDDSFEKAKSPVISGLYHARLLSQLVQSLTEKHGFPSSGEAWLTKLDILKASRATILPAAALLSGLGEAASGLRLITNLCNRLISDVAGVNLQSEKALPILILLNACMPMYELGELPVANNRLVFAVRQITSWLETPEALDYRLATEALRCLQRLLPCVKDVYGSYWQRTVDFCLYVWTKRNDESLDCRLPYINASLRLITILQALEEPNDDLTDVLQSTAEKRASALIELLHLPRDNKTQPLAIVDSIICRQVEKLPLEFIKDLSDIYGLVASEFREIQTAAFSLLHKALPVAQQQLSVDILLDKKEAQLPDELLSLLLDAPTLESYTDDVLAQFPTPIRSYLLSWHLIFDAFGAASFKIRGDYAENLKTANYIGPLMDFMFDVLGHSAAHPLNLDKANIGEEQIRTYDLKLADAEAEEQNMQWLLIHLYYLVLKYVPGLFKAWFIDCRSKQTKIAVESWMTKYFSPLIISDVLDDVEQWAKTQEPPADDEKELVVKVSRTAKEVTASYEVDETQAAISIRIPPAYPLEGVLVNGISRVAVPEKTWKGWIMTTQGVITFSGGSIIDGLTAFRRNIVGALKGQTECAICYSIISSDKRMPDKRCGTCKNLFHRTCLYKWFQSSNQNTCPLCRNPIDYLGADTRGRRAV